MKKQFRIRFFGSQSDNLKPVLRSEVEGSKIGNPKSKIERCSPNALAKADKVIK
jgi:hypothetical protein